MQLLVDANLPRKFIWFNKPDFFFVADWGDGIYDSEIWDHALKHNFTILTRDSDFFYRIVQANQFPKIVYFKLQQEGRKGLWKNIFLFIGSKYLH